MNTSFQQDLPLAARKQLYIKQSNRYPGKIILIIEPSEQSELPALLRPRFHCGRTHKIWEVKQEIVKRLAASSKQKTPEANSLMLMAKNTAIQLDQQLEDVYQKYCDEDGYLYLKYVQFQPY